LDVSLFRYLNGKRWHKFIEQYGMSQRVLPRMLIVDAPTEYFLPVPVDVKGQRFVAPSRLSSSFIPYFAALPSNRFPHSHLWVYSCICFWTMRRSARPPACCNIARLSIFETVLGPAPHATISDDKIARVGSRGTGEFLEKVAKGEIKMLRTWSATIKHHTKDTWHYIAAALAAVSKIPLTAMRLLFLERPRM
jgi:hypothetical protein